LIVLLIQCLAQSSLLRAGGVGATIGLAAPLVAASIAATPAILVDAAASTSRPLMGFVNAIIVQAHRRRRDLVAFGRDPGSACGGRACRRAQRPSRLS
jgi:hypothetical protein